MGVIDETLLTSPLLLVLIFLSVPRALSACSGVSERVLHSELVRGWPVEIRACGDKGFGLFASRPIPAGTVVFEEAPLACVVEARDPPEGEDCDESAEGEEQIEEELTDEQFQQTEMPSAPNSCAYCRAPLRPPVITDEAAAVPASHSDPATTAASSAAAWSELQRHPTLLRRLGLDDPSRTPLAAAGATPCRSNLPGHPSHEPSAPACGESYCGSVCESRAWELFHAREHMSAEEVARFDSDEMAQLLDDEHKRTILALLLRVTAMLRSRTDNTARAANSSEQQSHPQLSALDHLSHLSSLNTLSHAFTEAELSALDRAVAPMLQRVVREDPELQRRLCAAGAKAGKEGAWMLRQLLGALVSNSFRLAHAQPTLLLRRTGGRGSRGGAAEGQGVEVDVSVQHPLYSDSAAGNFTHYAALFSLATFLNHACMPHSNLAVELDPSVPLAHPASGASGTGRAPFSAQLVPPAGQAPRTRFAAVRDIPQGHELLWTYTLDASTLPSRYGFQCTCPACAPPARK